MNAFSFKTETQLHKEEKDWGKGPYLSEKIAGVTHGSCSMSVLV